MWVCVNHHITREGSTVQVPMGAPGQPPRQPGPCVLTLINPAHSGTQTVRRLGVEATCLIQEVT